tara:strand:+ start:5557 stop:6786 length:1230 start_codon:yes stop_codon:yes gene_type:complete
MHRGAAFSEFRLLLVASLALSMLSYITNIFLANAMGPDIFGNYSYALVLGALFGQLVFFGTAEMGVRLKINHGDAALDWILTLKIVNFGLLLATALVSALFRGDALLIFGVIVALNSLCFATHYEVQGRNVRYAIIFLVERALITATIWFGLLVLDASYMIWVFGTLAVFQGGSVAFQYSENRQYRICLDLRALFIAYKAGIYVLSFELSKFSFGGITRLLIFNQLGDERLGVFSTAWQFVPLSTLFLAQATKAWRLRITECVDSGDTSAVWRHIRALVIVVMLPTLCATGIFFVVGDRIIASLFSTEYSDAGQLMPYIGVYFLVIGFDSIVILLAIATSMARYASIIYLFFGGLTVLACLFLMEGRGLPAYLVAIVVGHFSATITLAFFTKRSLRRALHCPRNIAHTS